MIPELKPYEDIIFSSADKYEVKAQLICAVIMQESRGRAWSYRYEPTVKWSYYPLNYKDKLGISLDTEIMAQKTSWGLMQIMGFKAREMGYDNHLPQLLLPSVGIEWGCKVISSLQKKYSGDDVIAAYNGGSPRKDGQGKYISELLTYVEGVNSWLKVM